MLYRILTKAGWVCDECIMNVIGLLELPVPCTIFDVVSLSLVFNAKHSEDEAKSTKWVH